jgi:hypothetical protein
MVRKAYGPRRQERNVFEDFSFHLSCQEAKESAELLAVSLPSVDTSVAENGRSVVILHLTFVPLFSTFLSSICDRPFSLISLISLKAPLLNSDEVTLCSGHTGHWHTDHRRERHTYHGK